MTEQMTKIRVCSADALEVGSVLQIELEDRDPIALYRISDGYYATDDLCTHGAAFLSEGDVEDDEIYCPFHAGAFDIRTGEATAAPCVVAVRAHPVTVEGDDVYIEISN